MKLKNLPIKEYMPPEILTQLINKKEPKPMSPVWSMDVWGLGVVLLEVISGVPIWIPDRCKLMTINKRPKVLDTIFRDSNMEHDVPNMLVL